MIDIKKLKKNTFAEALKNSIYVYDKNNKNIAKLIPIGNWILYDKKLIQLFSNWRKIFKKYFFTEFEASVKNTTSYLKNLSIKKSNRIFFAVYINKKIVGHMGLSNIGLKKGEIDNFIRGQSGGPSNLFYLSEKALIKWAFEKLDLKILIGKMLSNNIIAKSLHEQIGFKIEKKYYLKKIVSKNSTTLKKCKKIEATEKFYLDIIKLNKSRFIAATKEKF